MDGLSRSQLRVGQHPIAHHRARCYSEVFSGSDRYGVTLNLIIYLTIMTTSLSSNTDSIVHPSHDEIAQGACELWEKAGQPEGRNDEFWFDAINRIRSNRQTPSVSEAIRTTLTHPVAVLKKVTDVKDEKPAKVRRAR